MDTDTKIDEILNKYLGEPYPTPDNIRACVAALTALIREARIDESIKHSHLVEECGSTPELTEVVMKFQKRRAALEPAPQQEGGKENV